MKCPNNHEMRLERKISEATFRGLRVSFPSEHYFCPTCKIEVSNFTQADKNQRALSDAYRKTKGLLTSAEIRKARQRLGWTQEQLAKALGVGIASVKRWEGVHIQTKSMDNLLRGLFEIEDTSPNIYDGNRKLSLPRIKLVLKLFAQTLGRELLKNSGRMLYPAKYLWYADMVSFRDLGQSITGATYAALPYGPQLNNYKDLVQPIIRAEEREADPLEPQEVRIIEKVAARFPTNRSIYDAVHSEEIYKNRSIGELIPYTDAERLKNI